mmetsp:Transcript_32546/g.78999  ORF Transcript_32546/g.78999 Transcript_32546/m.78999 type:complete len:299 (-) Transcript_32546:97-993(-)|eukprot:CAMPEP_0113631006 /NCGR_PEP_ID=MMETSP0017_2-20120614/16113_1 /TAXON_ID=2856 /ORGANISM="Cylindrotheca closterium" /LENGTH=298 /DNA_ID=CAMNT_0000541499 /DNA_START=42 /DNA_END=938 /DNA_ORIENTATION=- /assembly_acc=CAM_ASM_000147
MKTSFSILSIALLVAQIAGQCSLCPGGSRSITDIRAELVSGGLTCGDIDDKVRTEGTDDALCTAAKDDVNSEFDYSKFCCSDLTISNIQCNFCNGRKFDVNRILPADTNPQGLTCGEAKAMADVTIGKDSFTCQNILAANADCCDTACSICPLGSSLDNGSRVLPGQDTLTCEDFNLELGASENTSECNAKKAPFSDYDLDSYCGCSGQKPPETCNFVQECADGIEDRSMAVEGAFGLTCGSFERVADYIKTSKVCDKWKACCRSEETVTTARSGAMDSRISKLAAALTLGVLSLLSV